MTTELPPHARPIDDENAPLSRSWEYCGLTLWHVRTHGPNWFAHITVDFFGPTGGVWPLSLTPDEDKDHAIPWSFNPWGMAISQLGVGGWEMVSMQHANNRGMLDSSLSMVSHANATAYFKRPRSARREITDPFPRLEPISGVRP